MVKIDGLDALSRKLRAMPVAANAEIRKALDKNAAELESTMRTLAPIDLGNLRASIHTQDGAHELKVSVSAGNDETPAGPVEYGHDRDGPNGGAAPVPFVWPSYRLVRKRIRSRINRAVNTAAKKVART